MHLSKNHEDIWKTNVNIKHTQAAKVTHRQRWNGPVCCRVTLFAACMFHCVTAGGDWSAQRVFVADDLRPLTLTFKLVQARDQTRLSCKFGLNLLSSSRDIWFLNKKAKSQTALNRTQNLTQFTACGNYLFLFLNTMYMCMMCMYLKTGDVVSVFCVDRASESSGWHTQVWVWTVQSWQQFR